VVLTDAEVVHAHLLRENALFDDVAECFRVRKTPAFAGLSDVAERVESEDQ
jgi:hypothetical protein